MKKLSVLFGAFLLVVSMTTIKAQKIASLDVVSILNVMPEKKKVDADLKTLSDAKQAEIQKQAQAAQIKFKKYQDEAPKQQATVNQQREAEMQKVGESLQQMNQAAQADLAAKQEAAYAPIEKKFSDAVAKAAKANSWDFVFDANTSGLIYKGGADATAAVKAELGL